MHRKEAMEDLSLGGRVPGLGYKADSQRINPETMKMSSY